MTKTRTETAEAASSDAPEATPRRTPKVTRGSKDQGKAARTASSRRSAAQRLRDARALRRVGTETKQALMIAMLQSSDGATVEEMAKTFGWQRHSILGAIHGALRKRLGLIVTSQKHEGRGRVYRIQA